MKEYVDIEIYLDPKWFNRRPTRQEVDERIKNTEELLEDIRSKIAALEKEDDRGGMIYNEYTKTWSWL